MFIELFLLYFFQNSEGERKKSFGEIISEDFQRRYASNVIELANINRDLNEHLRNIQEFTQQVTKVLKAKFLSFFRSMSLLNNYGTFKSHLVARWKHYSVQKDDESQSFLYTSWIYSSPQGCDTVVRDRVLPTSP